MDKKQLEKLALRTGAVVTTDKGGQFNTTRSQVKTRPGTAKNQVAEPKQVKPSAAPQPAPVIDQKVVADAISNASADMVKMLMELKAQVAAIQLEAAQPPTEWVFDIIRDDKANLKQITAKAVTRLNS